MEISKRKHKVIYKDHRGVVYANNAKTEIIPVYYNTATEQDKRDLFIKVIKLCNLTELKK